MWNPHEPRVRLRGENVTNQDRARVIIDLWLQQARDERTGNHVLNFYYRLQADHPELVPVTRRGKDPYQLLQAILAHYRRGHPQR